MRSLDRKSGLWAVIGRMVDKMKRTEDGDAFSELVVEGLLLSGLLETIGGQLTKGESQSAARWKVMAAIEDRERTVASIARMFKGSRQGVQRLANDLARDGLVRFVTNPEDRRADFVKLTPQGIKVLRAIQVEQQKWADRLGSKIGKTRILEMRKEVQQLNTILGDDLNQSFGELVE